MTDFELDEHELVLLRQAVRLVDRLDALVKAGVPLLHVGGSRDPWLDTQTRVLEKRYRELGGQVTVIVQEGAGHFPTAPKDLRPVVEFITSRQR